MPGFTVLNQVLLNSDPLFRLETSDPVDLFDTLKEKPITTAPQNDDLLSLDFSGFGASPAPTEQKQVLIPSSV